MRDLNNRFRKIRKGEVDPVLEATFDKVAELGLLVRPLTSRLWVTSTNRISIR